MGFYVYTCANTGEDLRRLSLREYRHDDGTRCHEPRRKHVRMSHDEAHRVLSKEGATHAR